MSEFLQTFLFPIEDPVFPILDKHLAKNPDKAKFYTLEESMLAVVFVFISDKDEAEFFLTKIFLSARKGIIRPISDAEREVCIFKDIPAYKEIYNYLELLLFRSPAIKKALKMKEDEDTVVISIPKDIPPQSYLRQLFLIEEMKRTKSSSKLKRLGIKTTTLERKDVYLTR